MDKKNDSWAKDAADMFKNRENPIIIGNVVGEVEEGFPNLKISILDKKVLLERDQLYCTAHVLAGYTRQTKNNNIEGSGLSSTGASTSHRLQGTIPYNSYEYSGVDIPQYVVSEETSTMEYTDTLVKGDYVLLIHDESMHKWFIVDKIEKL